MTFIKIDISEPLNFLFEHGLVYVVCSTKRVTSGRARLLSKGEKLETVNVEFVKETSFLKYFMNKELLKNSGFNSFEEWEKKLLNVNPLINLKLIYIYKVTLRNKRGRTK